MLKVVAAQVEPPQVPQLVEDPGGKLLYPVVPEGEHLELRDVDERGTHLKHIQRSGFSSKNQDRNSASHTKARKNRYNIQNWSYNLFQTHSLSRLLNVNKELTIKSRRKKRRKLIDQKKRKIIPMPSLWQ